VLEDQASDKLGEEFDNHWGGWGILLGRDGKCVDQGEVEDRFGSWRQVTTLLSDLEDGEDDLSIDDVGYLAGGSVAVDRQTVDSDGVHAHALVEAVYLLRKLVDDGIFFLELLAEEGVLLEQVVDGFLEHVNLG